MAVVKLGTAKTANRLISYCEKRAEEREGVMCDPDYAKSQFKATRSLWGKEGGIQAHHAIMSFPPYYDNMTPQEVAEAGRELAEKLAPGHEAAVYVHTDKDHWHAHVVINAVSYESGKKLHLTPADYWRTQELSDTICKERGWHTIKQRKAPERYTLAEREIIAKGELSWKDEIRSWIREGQQYTKNMDELCDYLQKAYGVEMKLQDKNVSFLHPEKQKYVRGKSLGDDFTKEGLNRGYELARATEAARTTGQPSRPDERAGKPTERANQTDRLANRVADQDAREHRHTEQEPKRHARPANEALREGREGLQRIAKRASDRTPGAQGHNGEDAPRMATTDLQPQGKGENVPSRGSERGSSGFSGDGVIQTILNNIQREIRRLEGVREDEQKRQKNAQIKVRRNRDDHGRH